MHYLKVFDHVQVRYAGHEWRQLVELVAQAAHEDSKVLSICLYPARLLLFHFTKFK